MSLRYRAVRRVESMNATDRFVIVAVLLWLVCLAVQVLL